MSKKALIGRIIDLEKNVAELKDELAVAKVEVGDHRANIHRLKTLQRLDKKPITSTPVSFLSIFLS